ncbi:collagen-like domain-containing protein [Wolbachia endosymbiont of Ctenocephalides felis wCfeT]|uniref:collagen-like protein n=1 Tax=Wolbachia endosymbiont of Ctenocephalides felis wCfeT TaxID=2732593 RepID=UPI0014485AD5|nr:collagen-like protein [Wolbachia endosymbiont of Ctenocephalides felis wCfeT]
MKITKKEGEDYECELIGNIGNVRYVIPFSLDEANIDRFLLKQFELEGQIQKISQAAEVISVDAVASKISSDRTHSYPLAAAILEKDNVQGHILRDGVAHYFTQLVRRESDLQALVKGERGERGLTGLTGPQGSPSRDSKIPTSDEIAGSLIKNTTFTEAVLLKKMIDPGDTTHTQKTLADKVKEKLKADSNFQEAVKGADGTTGPAGPRGAEGIRGANAQEVVTELMTSSNLAVLKKEIAGELRRDPGKAIDPEGPAGRDGAQGLRGPTGPRGLQGIQGKEGKKGADSSAQDVANVLVTTKSTELGEAILNIKDPYDQSRSKLSSEIGNYQPFRMNVHHHLKNDWTGPFAVKIADELRNDPGNARGPMGNQGPPGRSGKDGEDGKSPSVTDVAQELITNNKTELGTTVLNATGTGGNLATQIANKVNLDPQSLLSKVDPAQLTECVVSKLAPEEAKKITEDTINEITGEATKKNNPDPDAFRKYEEFARKLAELLVRKGAMSEEDARELVKSKVPSFAF